MEAYFYIKPEDLEDVEKFVEDYDLYVSLQCVMDSFGKHSINKPVLKLVKDKNKSLLKFVMLFNENTNMANIFYHPINLINEFNSEHPQKINVYSVDGVCNHFMGAISVNGTDRILFEFITPSMLLSSVYEF